MAMTVMSVFYLQHIIITTKRPMKDGERLGPLVSSSHENDDEHGAKDSLQICFFSDNITTNRRRGG